MYFLGIGIVLLILKLMQIGPIGGWSWLIVLTPFALAAAWWVWADASGYTKRKEMEKMDAIRENRLQKQREALKNPARRRR
ncbi:MAG: TIGR04438 family Trp-rich protein [Brachymonas sp.]|jgi:small Trp-rich protein|nr:TIGR04438 family Trp-rich protein [Brachymonas sp.]MBP8820800.1 TIGR04438 family Trp-rich protein [Brachymonas sp.]